MWWNKEKEEPTAAVEVPTVAEVPKQVAPPKPEPEVPPFGTQAHGLTRFGNTWINLSELAVLEFDPPDGCGAECQFKGDSSEVWHIPDADARALRAYLEGFESAQKAVDDAAARTFAVNDTSPS